MNSKIKQWLYARADNPRQNLILLGIGFVTFFIGLLLLGSAEYLLKSSISQEILALTGLIIICTGIILAAIGYLSLSILRILRFISDDNHD
ncbi:hypothetical protein [uncultured Neptuniibacter sp.]|uniref:hypothetical protein n=1 Tax=uncultured Neptuniibacter sp. TaxID=502143 RepID=UPI0026332C73|nr:hypothetical protein [uncultured Neptuniibacter sp.]